MTVTQVRLLFEPFERITRDPDHSDEQFAMSIGRSTDCLKRYRQKGILFYSADKLAIDNGMHPSYIWGDAYWYPEKPHPYVVKHIHTPKRMK